MSDKTVGYRSTFSWIMDEYFLSLNSKLSFLWFDEIIVETPFKSGVQAVLDHMVKKGDISIDIASEMNKQIFTIHKYIPDYDNKSQLYRDKPLILGSYFEDVLKWAIEFVLDEEYLSQKGEHFDPMDFDMRTYMSFNAIRYWKKLNQSIGCSFIPIPFEHKVLKSMSSDFVPNLKQFNSFKEVVQFRLPNLGRLSINEIYEIRHSDFFTSFRKKILEINSIIETGEANDLEELIEELERKDTKKLLKLVRPKFRETMLLTILANVPIPPVNPIGIAQGMHGIIKEKQVIDKYGWLYFLLDVEELQTEENL